MHKHRKLMSVWEHYITVEIGIEFKACLYFFAILFFYCMYQLVKGSVQAGILHMAEMILLTYGMGYVQVYVLSNFDEAEKLGKREWVYLIICSFIYTGASYLGGWFDKQICASIVFYIYMVLLFLCVFLVYKCRREMDEKVLNDNLKVFQARRREDAECDRD